MVKIAMLPVALVLLLGTNTAIAIGTVDGTIEDNIPLGGMPTSLPDPLNAVPVDDNLVGVVQITVFTDVQQAYPDGWSPGVGTGIPSPPTVQIQLPPLGGSMLPALPDDLGASNLPALMAGATHSVLSGGVGHVAGDLPGLVVGSPPNILGNYGGPTRIGN